MKTADIKVGRRYKTRWSGIVEIAEVGVNYGGRRSGVRVEGTNRIFNAVEVLHEWTDEHEAEVKRLAQERRLQEARASELEQRAREAGLGLDVHFWTRDRVQMSLDTFEMLLAAYEIAMAE